MNLEKPRERRLCDLRGAQDGAAAVEFALLAPLMFLLVAGAVDGGRVILQGMQVRAVAQAGADHAARNGGDAASAQAAALAAVPATAQLAATARLTSGCVSGGTVTETTGAKCASGATPGTYVAVEASRTFKTFAPWPSLLWPDRLSAAALVRVS
jgi:Flp pilus assembly protein TadG